MRFFQYNEQVINLEKIIDFSFITNKESRKPHTHTLFANLDYSQDQPLNIYLGTFNTKDDGLQVVKNILAGVYDIMTLQPVAVNVNPQLIPAGEETPESDTQPEQTAETQQTTETETQEQPDDPEELEKTIEGTRELYRLEQTNIVCKELGIDKAKLYGEAQRLWGKSETWTQKSWETYLHAIANFHNRTGVLYDALKPKTDQPTGATQATEKQQGPF